MKILVPHLTLSRLALACLALASLLDIVANPSALARDQWQMHYQDEPPPTQAVTKPTAASIAKSGIPGLGPDFWNSQMANRVPAGTVLSGILEDDLSSATSHVGDVFSLRLQDGLVLNDQEVIPKNARIVGTVTGAMSAATLRGGQPGQLQVSLQSLVLPDGRHLRFFGFINHNANLDHQLENSTVSQAKNGASYAGRAVTGFFGTLGSRVGLSAFVPKPTPWNQGRDFILKKGEVIPVKLNRALRMPQKPQAVTSANFQPPSTATANWLNSQTGKQQYRGSFQPREAPGSVPGLVGPDPQARFNAVPPNVQSPANQFVSPQLASPQLVSPQQMARPQIAQQSQMPAQAELRPTIAQPQSQVSPMQMPRLAPNNFAEPF
jgi:hypothetical protein